MMMTRHTTTLNELHRRRSYRSFTLIELLIVIGLILLLVAITVTVSIGVLRQSEVRETANVLTILDGALEEWLLQDQHGLTYGRGVNHGFGNGEPCGTVARPQTYVLPQLAAPGSHTGWTEDATPRDIAQEETDLLIATLLRRPVFEDMIAAINSRYMRRVQVIDPPEDQLEQPDDLLHLTSGDYLDFTPEYIYRFVDAWERPIVAVHPGRSFERQRCNFDLSNYCVGSGQTERCGDDDGTIRTPLENAFGVAQSQQIYFVSAGPDERLGLMYLHEPDSNLTQPQREQVDRAGDNIYSHPIDTEQARPQ